MCYRNFVSEQPIIEGACYEDIKDLAPELIGELLAGDLFTRRRPSNREAVFSSSLGMDIGAAFHRGRGGPGGWIVIDKPELHLGEDVVVPDIAGWRRERLPQVPDEAHFSLAPDWVCEVISPSTARRERTVNLGIYLREKVKHYWIVDVRAQTLEILRLDGEGYRLVGVLAGDAKVRAEPFDAIELDLGELWPTGAESSD